MNWTCEVAPGAEGDLKGLPRDAKERVARTLSRMETDPFQGDVKALKGKEWKGFFRRRLGSYRIVFTADQKNKTVTVFRILLRSKKTYQ
ncbi:MAG: type II toxin-antitoxin system RelE/ParE family toxin [Bryobacterales bacterium]|nr:type II toxin-antitoxin system RelE/ParE family toxin [Bryobacterales bacterium]